MTPKKKVVVEKIAKKWLSTDEAASYIGMGKSFIVELRKSGKLPHCMIGHSAFFLSIDIDYLIEIHRIY
mgnify:FL=1